jgi:hypothetical protein
VNDDGWDCKNPEHSQGRPILTKSGQPISELFLRNQFFMHRLFSIAIRLPFVNLPFP